ncbi:MAG: hypothetical protein AB8F78_08145 [Saprospiraceae bacterium]
MNKKILYILATYALLVFAGMTSCDNCDDDFNSSKFKTTDISSKLQYVSYVGSSFDELDFDDLELDTVSFDRLAIRLKFEQVDYGINSPFRFNLIQSAYACDPAPPTTDERLDSIVIKSTIDFNAQLPAGSNLSQLFDVVVYSNDNYNERFDLNEYLSTMPAGPNWLILLLKEQPAETGAFSFDIAYHQDGIDNDLFEFTTESVVIR